MLGEFDTSTADIRFRGKRVPVLGNATSKSEQKDQASVGLLLSSRALADGRVSAQVEFAKVTEETICEVVVAYDPNASHLVSAGLGGAQWAMFGIREFGGPPSQGQGWWQHQARGERASIQTGKAYQLSAKFHGAIVSLEIDSVLVASAEVSSPTGRLRQVGLLCKGDHEITIRNFCAEPVKPKAFCVMQFGGDYDDVYTDVVKQSCRAYEVNVMRADEVMGPGLIISDIIREIAASQLVIADISCANPNVYFEVGYALAMRKPTILLARKDTALPFDVAGFRVLFYENTIGGKGKLEDGLRRHLESILAL
jgi:hypothetical protein